MESDVLQVYQKKQNYFIIFKNTSHDIFHQYCFINTSGLKLTCISVTFLNYLPKVTPNPNVSSSRLPILTYYFYAFTLPMMSP